jgi:serine/threonine-protein kinase
MQPEQLGPYKIGRKLGRGGMGTVYEAVLSDTGEPAAVKVLSAAMSRDEGFRERFEAEIETLRKLRHPNIVRLFGYGEQDGVLFYAMELVKGTSLEDELQNSRRFDWREVTRIGIQMSRALKHAHDSGVIHRDIKPANLLLTAEGDVKLSDFGIAKLFGATGLTADGGVLGTAEYMSPEQAEGRPVTHRSDLYSLGGVLYALVAGRPPFRAKSIPEMLQLQRFAEPDPLRRYCNDVPDELAAIVAQLLEKDPDKRIPSAMILARRLEAMEHGLSVRRAENISQTTADPGSGRIEICARSDSDNGSEYPLDVTKADTPMPQKKPSHASDVDLGETRYTGQGSSDGGYSLVEIPEPSLSQTTGHGRFTAVQEEEETETSTLRETLAILISPHTLLLIGALVCLGLVAAYLLQPPSVDKLYADIMTLASDENPERLLEAEDEITRFLSLYPQDPRADEMKSYRDDIELTKLERRFDRRARQLKLEESSAVVRAYLEAMYLANFDPQQAITQLEALLALYGQEGFQADALPSDPGVIAVQLAQKKLPRLRATVKEQARDDLKLLRKQLAEADKLYASEPAKARAMWEGIVVLYEKKTWAQELVEQARKRLAMGAAEEPQTARARS